ncbi:MAG: dihydrofolate reductase family protein [Acidobacteria bacterium]|nr:dihydrofolate reductase family protein [Acidobacteriota bacterium]
MLSGWYSSEDLTMDRNSIDIQAPFDLRPFEVLFDQSEPNLAFPPGLLRFVGNLGFPKPPAERPWVYANFVQSLDGLVSFGGRRPGGEWVAQSRHDRWMMDLLRTQADALLCGARSLILETLYGGIPGGPVYRVVDPELLRLREERLGRRKLITILVTGRGDLRLSDYRLFRSHQVEAWVATTPAGRVRLGDTGQTRVLVTGQDGAVDLRELLHSLRADYGIEYLLCEGGPSLYGHMIRGGWMDEKFVTIAPQEIGAGLPPQQERTQWEIQAGTATRPTSFVGAGFSIEEARWYHWMSCRRAGNHEFNRYRAR